MSFGVSAEAGSATPGRLIPLCSPSGPPPTTVVVAVVPSDDSTRSSMRPSSRSSRSPCRTDLARPAKVVDTRPGPPTKSPVAISSDAPGTRSIALWSASLPVRILGPDRSWRMATCRPARSAAWRMRTTTAPCSAWVPCEKLRRKTSVPAAMSASSAPSAAQAGPTVAMILVSRPMGNESSNLGGALGYHRGLGMLPEWFETARADAERRGLGHILPVLEALRASGERLRRAPWADQATARIALGGATLAPAAISPPPDPAAAPRPAVPMPTIAQTAAALRAGDLTASALADATLDGHRPRQPAAQRLHHGDDRSRPHRRRGGRRRTPHRGRPRAAARHPDQRQGSDRRRRLRRRRRRRGSASSTAPRADAAVVTRLREAGAVIIGKTNLHEFALGPTSEDSAYGPPRHPLDPSRLPGGSSGGSAAAVAAGLGFGSVGTDTGCSVRIPAALCGIVGLKPRFGDVPLDGVLPLSRRLDHVGPLGADRRRRAPPLSRHGGTPRARGRAHPGSRLDSAPAWSPPRSRRGSTTPCVEPSTRRSSACARPASRSQPAPLGVLDDAAAAYLPICLADAAALHAATLETQASDYTPGVRARLEAGRYVAGEDYARATQAQAVMRHAVDRALGRCDVLILPTSPTTAPAIGTTTVRFADGDEPIRNALLRLCQPFNLTRHPAITLPGAAARGRPARGPAAGRERHRAAARDRARGRSRARRSLVVRPFFHAWERRIHAGSLDRVVRPFDWGLDWLARAGLPPIDASGDDGRFAAALSELGRGPRRDLADFYAVEPGAGLRARRRERAALRERGGDAARREQRRPGALRPGRERQPPRRGRAAAAVELRRATGTSAWPGCSPASA